MQCLPAIDLRGGKAVRLLRGDFDAETTYGDPIAIAESYLAAGAPALHLVDLDAARTGEPVNRAIVLELLGRLPVPVQVGGGVRSKETALELLGAGAARVVLGTAGLEDPDLTGELALAHPGRIALGLDHRRVGPSGTRREVAVRGWEEGSGRELLEVLGAFEHLPLGAVVVTDITKDGTLEGPDLEGYRLLLEHSGLPIVASGGIGAIADVEALGALEHDGRRLAGAIIGKALLSGAMTMREAVSACTP
jgi:phosphoribosylformimino-5-aminoimidazole carboxamide ribotide isomerase